MFEKCHHQNTLQMERCMWKTCLQFKACVSQTVELYGGETSRERVSDVAELKIDIVNKITRIIGPDRIQVSKNACML